MAAPFSDSKFCPSVSLSPGLILLSRSPPPPYQSGYLLLFCSLSAWKPRGALAGPAACLCWLSCLRLLNANPAAFSAAQGTVSAATWPRHACCWCGQPQRESRPVQHRRHGGAGPAAGWRSSQEEQLAKGGAWRDSGVRPRPRCHWQAHVQTFLRTTQKCRISRNSGMEGKSERRRRQGRFVLYQMTFCRFNYIH